MPIDQVQLNFNPQALLALNFVLAFVMFGVALVGVAVGAAGYFFLRPEGSTRQAGGWHIAPTATGLAGTF